LEDDLKVVGETDRGEDASAALRQRSIRTSYSWIVQLPGISGIEATAALLRDHA
jgi:hypothetical protein